VPYCREIRFSLGYFGILSDKHSFQKKRLIDGVFVENASGRGRLFSGVLGPTQTNANISNDWDGLVVGTSCVLHGGLEVMGHGAGAWGSAMRGGRAYSLTGHKRVVLRTTHSADGPNTSPCFR
jgi:hypothetical protein